MLAFKFIPVATTFIIIVTIVLRFLFFGPLLERVYYIFRLQQLVELILLP